MTDHSELLRLTQDLLKKKGYSQNEWEEFHEAANPEVILALLIEHRTLLTALAHARQDAINAKGIAGICVKALTQAEGFVAYSNNKAWGSDEGIGGTLPLIRDTMQRAKIFGKGNPQ